MRGAFYFWVSLIRSYVKVKRGMAMFLDVKSSCGYEYDFYEVSGLGGGHFRGNFNLG